MPPRTTRLPPWRLLIAGGGPSGLALALALRQGLGDAVAVSLLDPGLGLKRTDLRAYALSPGAAAFCKVLGVWADIRDRVQPIEGMTITDSRLGDAVRPAYLRFGGEGETLAYMIEAEPLADAMRDACLRAGVELAPDRVETFEAGPEEVVITTASRDVRRASLLVAADGARSRLREAAGIQWFGRRYPQWGIVATVTHEREHEGRAVQHFLPSGPFAILPLPGGCRSSIVWTEESARVPALLRLGQTEATREVATRFGLELGPIELETDLLGHPLAFGLARDLVADRLALLGDAAHEVHPLAGQGLNLGLGDAAALAERVADTVRLGLDPGSRDVLSGYARDRRFDAVALASATDGLNRLFSNDNLPARVLRDLGLGLVDRMPGTKSFFEHQATGSTRRAPRLMRGEAL